MTPADLVRAVSDARASSADSSRRRPEGIGGNGRTSGLSINRICPHAEVFNWRANISRPAGNSGSVAPPGIPWRAFSEKVEFQAVAVARRPGAIPGPQRGSVCGTFEAAQEARPSSFYFDYSRHDG